MTKTEENSLFDIEENMEIDEIGNIDDIFGDPLYFMNNNNTIIFGFYDKSKNSFYKTEEFKSKKFKINPKSKELEIKYFSNNLKHSRLLIYNLLDNAPVLIKSITNFS